MGKKEQVPALAIFVQGSLWVWSATSRGRPPDGGLALAVFHMVPRVPAALLISSYILLLISAKSCSLPRLALRVCSASPSSALRRLATGPPQSVEVAALLVPLPNVPSAADAVCSGSPRVPGSALLSSALVSASSSPASIYLCVW